MRISQEHNQVPNKVDWRIQTTTHIDRFKLRLILAFAIVSLVWGSTYLAIRVGLDSFSPLLLAAMRNFTAGLVLYPVSRWQTRQRPTRAQWKTAAITGVLLIFCGHGGVCVAEKTVPSGIAALLAATVTLWIVLLDWLRPNGTRPAWGVICGLVLGFVGFALLVGPRRPVGSDRVDLTGALILVLGTLAWACGSLYSKHGVLPQSAMLGVAMQCLCGGAALGIAAWLAGEFSHMRIGAIAMRAWVAVLDLIVFGSVVGFSAYLYVLRNCPPARAATYAFLNPVVALVLGTVFLHEPITFHNLLAAAVILAAVLLVITASHAPETSEASGVSSREVLTK